MALHLFRRQGSDRRDRLRGRWSHTATKQRREQAECADSNKRSSMELRSVSFIGRHRKGEAPEFLSAIFYCRYGRPLIQIDSWRNLVNFLVILRAQSCMPAVLIAIPQKT